ncbi:MAG: hypothetical protein HY964_08440 [Ignavibacteriales bacterium]|nr:hypothetical protein [Ignavibacteriales bacterium]
MGQQQLLLLILGVIIVGLAIAVGVTMFSAQSTESNKDGITSGLMSIAANAYEYKIRPRTLGGGLPSYVGYSVPLKLQSDENGTYQVFGSITQTQVQIRGISSQNSSWNATCTIDSMGQTMISYNGW